MQQALELVLSRLQKVSGPNASGEYSALCPAHNDHTPTLTITVKPSDKDGKERVFFNCHRNCPQDAILAAMGLKWKDLIIDPDPPKGKGSQQAGKRSGAAKTQQGTENAAETTEKRTTFGPDEVIMVNGVEYRVRTVDDQGRPLDVNGNVIPGAMVNPKTGELVGGVVVHTVETVDPATGEVIVPGMTVHQAVPVEPAGKGAAGGASAAPPADEPVPDWAHPDRVYSYTDEDGKELFQVVRLHYKDGKPGKTFRQRVKDPGNPKANRDGYVNSVPAEIRDVTLYRLPAVKKAIKEGRPVYVVEGEKDVETLERLGHVATCNPGGAGKWRDGYSLRLIGADVIILPDNDSKGNDFTGQNHAYDVALKLQGMAKRVRLVDIKAACPDLPEKGDISDMVQIMGDVGAMDALARQVNATNDFDPDAVPFWLTPMEQAERLYSAVKGYGVQNGCIVQETGDAQKPLCDFVVIPRMELEKDDGMNVSKHFVLDGWNGKGRKLGRVTIPAGQLEAMNWVTENWGFDASLMPGSTTKSKVAWAIKKVGQMTAKRVTEYTHSGWRKIGGKYCYLYHGGAVGAEGITVDMGQGLKTYRLDGSGAEGFDRITWQEAATTSLRIKDVMRPEIGIALLGTMYLAPLREFMAQTDIAPAFGLFLYGESGTHKSTAASLALAHFGNFHAKNPPTSFADTGNAIREKAFAVKDMPILVDDFHPTTSLQEKRAMSATAQALSRAFGDGADRGRLNADSSIKGRRPPRSVAVITGEDLPAIGASGLARFFILDIDKGDIPVGNELTELQELARKGYLQRAMRGYILWLSKQADKLPEQLHEQFLKYREDIRRDSGGQHDRAPETVACILIGYYNMLSYMVDAKAISPVEAGTMMIEARTRLTETARNQAQGMESEKPTRIFLDNLAELLNSKQVALKDLTNPDAKDPPPTEKMVGYMDNEYYYLLPNVAFANVARLCREQGQEFPVSLKALYKHLRTDGILRGLGKDENPTRLKWINERPKRVLWIPAELMIGPKANAQQMTMTQVGNEVLPEEFKR